MGSEATQPLFLVTGATGFLGGELTRMLIERGDRVRVLVRDASKADAFKQLGCEIVTGDLQNFESLQRATKGIYGVYHVGALYREAKFPESIFYDINAAGTRRLLEASIENGVQRFVHCSTGGVLGGVKNPPGTDKHPYNPGDMYQRSKVEGEKIALDYFRSGRIRGVIIRPGMIYGPGDTRHLKLFKMIKNHTFFYVGNGTTRVHFVDVRDVANAFILAMQHTELNAEIYHIPGESSVPLRDAVKIIAQRLGVREPWLHLPVKPMQWLGSLCEAICKPFGISPPLYRRRVDFFTKTRHFDITKAKRELGYQPARPLQDEIQDTVEWYQSHGWL